MRSIAIMNQKGEANTLKYGFSAVPAARSGHFCATIVRGEKRGPEPWRHRPFPTLVAQSKPSLRRPSAGSGAH